MASSSSRSTHSSREVLAEVQDVYLYALRVAYLAVLSATTLPLPAAGSGLPPAPSLASSASIPTRASLPPLKSSHSFRPVEGWTNTLLFKDVSTPSSAVSAAKGVKFPKELIKVLDEKLQRIALGKDKEEYRQILLRETIGVFWNQFGTAEFKRKLLEERKIEELILRFVAVASKKLRERLRGDAGGETEGWKEALNAQVVTFVRIVKECLQSRDIGKVAPELFTRLDAYAETIAPASTALSDDRRSSLQLPRTSTLSSMHSRTGSVSSDLTADPTTAKLNGVGPTNVLEMPLVLAVGDLFGKSNEELRKDVIALRRSCTEAAPFHDLKALINNLATGKSYPASATDFESDEAFQIWKRKENSELQELLIEMLQRDPTLVKATRAESVVAPEVMASDRRSIISTEGTDGDAFFYIPTDPKSHFQRLLETALAYAIDNMRHLPPEEDVALTILSPIHESLLQHCAKRWRIMPTFRLVGRLTCVIGRYNNQEVPLACVGEALENLDECAEEWEYWRWPILDRIKLSHALSPLFNDLLTRFFDIFQNLGSLTYADVLPLLSTIHANPVFQEDTQGLPALLNDLRGGMKKFVAISYVDREEDLLYEREERERIAGPSERSVADVELLLKMLEWISAEAKRFSRLFLDSLVGEIDVPALFLSVVAAEFVNHLARSRSSLLAAYSRRKSPSAVGTQAGPDVFELYRRTRELKTMHDAFNKDSPLTLDFLLSFEPCVWSWLADTDTKTSEWVKAAIASDNFEPEFDKYMQGSEKHSSSIIDLFDSCKSAMNFVLELKWPNEHANARFLTRLSHTIAKSIEQYSLRLETLFLAEMFPRLEEGGIDQDVARPSAWMTKARLAVQGDKKVEPFVFQAPSCAKLNNIQAARRLLDTMYTTFDVDKVAEIISSHSSVTDSVVEQSQYLFTIKMVLGENLVNPDGGSRAKLDPFLILSNPQGDRVAKTRTLYETNDPRWEETVDVSVHGDLWIRATIYNRNLVDHHDVVALAYLHLNPADFGDFLTRDIWLQLEDVRGNKLEGRLLLRISMEGEKDDIQFYFGRAFRSLKRAENDMTRTIVDKMSPFIRHYLSHNSLNTLIKPGYNFDIDLDRVRGDFSKVSGKFNAFVRDAISQSSSPVIPPVKEFSDSPMSPGPGSGKRKGRGPLTDQEIENAIGDLFDYFNVTFNTLMENLSTQAWDLVVARLWKDILGTIEALIVPPLSERQTEMKPLSEKELDIVFKWLGFLVNFFHSSGDGVPLEELRNAKYRGLVEARLFYDWSSDQLMEEAVQTMKRQLVSSSPTILGRTKSVYQQRNLGTIRARKIGKKQTQDTSGEMILRILRMRPGSSDFLRQQMSTMASLQVEHARKQRLGSLQRNVNNSRAGGVGSSRQKVAGGRSGASGRGLPSIPS